MSWTEDVGEMVSVLRRLGVASYQGPLMSLPGQVALVLHPHAPTAAQAGVETPTPVHDPMIERYAATGLRPAPIPPEEAA